MTLNRPTVLAQFRCSWLPRGRSPKHQTPEPNLGRTTNGDATAINDVYSRARCIDSEGQKEHLEVTYYVFVELLHWIQYVRKVKGGSENLLSCFTPFSGSHNTQCTHCLSGICVLYGIATEGLPGAGVGFRVKTRSAQNPRRCQR